MAVLLTPGEGIVEDAPPTKRFQEYPKLMTHPAYKRGDPGPELKTANGFGYYNGTPERFGPMLVKSRDQEEYHKAQGYETQDHPNPAAAFQRLIDSQAPANAEPYVMQMYPKWVAGKLVNNAQEEAAVLAAQGAPAAPPAPPPPEPVAEEPAAEAEVNPPQVAQQPETREERKARLLRELEEIEVAEQAAEIARSVDTEIKQQLSTAEPQPERPMTQGEKIKAGKAKKALQRAAAEAAKK